MKIKISDYYANKGYKNAYIITNRENRRIAILIHNDKSRKTISYAKYLYTSYYECDIENGYHVDHINGDKMDDRIENLQVITGTYNVQKDHQIKELVLLTCPVCGMKFIYEKRNLSTHPNPCCSRRCGGIKSHWK